MSNRIPRLATTLSALLLLLASAACSDSPARVVAPDARARQDMSGIPSSATTSLTLLSQIPPGLKFNFTPTSFVVVGPYLAKGGEQIGEFWVYCINLMTALPEGTNWPVKSLTFDEAIQDGNLEAIRKTLGNVSQADMLTKLRQAAHLSSQFKTQGQENWDELHFAMWKLFPIPSTTATRLVSTNPTLEAQFLTNSAAFAASSASTSTWRILVDARAWDPTVAASALRQTLIVNNAQGLGDFVWHDSNADGIQNPGEPGIAEATVTIDGPNGFKASTKTDANGAYQFPNLAAGAYTMCVATPSGYTDASPTGKGGNVAKDSDGGVGNCASVTLPPNEFNPNIDFGFFKRAAVGDLVWYDRNGDGVQDAGEPGISGATVTITGPNSFTASTTTSGTGGYAFTNLLPGTYTICVATPAGYTGPTLAGQGGDAAKDSNGSGTPNCATVTLTSGQTDNTIDFGFVPLTGTIGNYTWIDANGNGRQDAGEPALNGVQLQLSGTSSATQTSANGGQYLFTSLVAGSYTVRATAPAGFTFTTANSPLATNANDSNANPTTVTLAAGENNLTIDFGFVPLPGSGQGCTPGFWKQSQKYRNWKWYTRTDMVDAVFGVSFRSSARNNPVGALSLLQALELNGNGGGEQLFRHGTAALLNAVYQSGVSYPFTAAQVITMVRTAWTSGNATTIANTHQQLAAANERGCPLS